MGPRPIGTPDPEVHVTYNNTKGDARLSKSFDSLLKARGFYMRMLRAGRCPHYKNPNKEPRP